MLQKNEGDIDVPDLGLGATEELPIPEVEEIEPEPVEESIEPEPEEKFIEPEELTVPDIPAAEEIIEPEPVEESIEPEELMMEERRLRKAIEVLG